MDCTICMEGMDEDMVVNYCDHRFHRRCILKWQDACKQQGLKTTCPICRCRKIIITRDISLKECRQMYMDIRVQYMKLVEEHKTTIHYKNQIIDYEEQMDEYEEQLEDCQEKIKDYENTLEQVMAKLAQVEKENMELKNRA